MREIKFRAWDIKDKIMCYPECFIFNQDWSYDTNWSAWKNIKSDDRTFVTSQRQGKLMQYTGLKDKNGTEIYEGDIVKHYNGIKEVQWDIRSGAWDMCLSDYVVDQEDVYEPDKMEVIGNIYENPELLKGGEEVI